MVSPNYFRVINASIHIIVFLGCAAYAMDLVTNKPLGLQELDGEFSPVKWPRNQVKGENMIEIHSAIVVGPLFW